MEGPFTDDLDECDRNFGVVTARTGPPKPKPPLPKPMMVIRHSFKMPLNPPRAPCVDRILPAVAKVFEVTELSLLGRSHMRKWAWPRFCAFLMYSERADWSLPHIGRKFNRHHSTVLSGIRKALDLIESDEWYRSKVEAVRAELG